MTDIDALIARLRDFPHFISQDGAHWLKSGDKESLCIEAADALSQLQKDAGRWIPVGERLPKVQTHVLAVEPQTFAHPVIAYFTTSAGRHMLATRWVDTNGEYIDVTHWMPLPNPPDAAQEAKP